MSDIALELFAIDRALDRDIDRLAAVYMDGINGPVARHWLSDILGMVDRLDRRGAALAPTATNQQRARGAEAAIRRSLDASGFLAQTNASFNALDAVARHAGRGLRKAGQTGPTPANVAEGIGIYRAFKIKEFEHLADRHVVQLATTISRAVMAGQNAVELAVELQEIIKAFGYEARTLYETTAAEFAQTFTVLRGGTDAQRVYLYSGPIDQRIRQFCLGLVGRVLSRPRIDRLDNRQLPNSFLTRGGYNCRHQWRDVTAIPALARLADTGQFAHDQIAAQVQAMQAYQKIAGRARGRRSA